MTCTECRGWGWDLVPVEISWGEEADWRYDKADCSDCDGKGYLTPEEIGLEVM